MEYKDNIIAILRGIKPTEVEEIFEILLDAGVNRIEIPLNSPDAFTSIANMVEKFGDIAQIGAGTVLNPAEVTRLKATGAKFVVSPNCDEEVIKAAIAHNLEPYPGIFSPTDAFNAIKWGAKNLKLFPASVLGLEYYKAIKEVLPKDIKVWAVGGIKPENFGQWSAAGIDGFGIGSNLYKAGDSAATVKAKAAALFA